MSAMPLTTTMSKQALLRQRNSLNAQITQIEARKGEYSKQLAGMKKSLERVEAQLALAGEHAPLRSPAVAAS